MKEIYNKYLSNKLKYEKYQIIGIICLTIAFSGFFGWVYEFIFYYFNGGMKEFYMQGGNFLPWINIYAYGAILIMFFSHKFKKKPILVFLISLLSTGLLEFMSGYILFKFFGLRFWNYNVEIWNFGNINGYICFRSVTFFAISGMFLMYVILPFFAYLSFKMKKKNFLILSISLCALVLIDEIYNLIIVKLFNLPGATKFYRSLGFDYVK